MPRPRSSTRKIREALRMRFEEKRSYKAIATNLNVGETTVSDLLARAAAAGVGWPLPAEMGDAELETRLFKPK